RGTSVTILLSVARRTRNAVGGTDSPRYEKGRLTLEKRTGGIHDRKTRLLWTAADCSCALRCRRELRTLRATISTARRRDAAGRRRRPRSGPSVADAGARRRAVSDRVGFLGAPQPQGRGARALESAVVD